MKKSVFIRLLTLALTAALSVSLLVLPAAAADTEPTAAEKAAADYVAEVVRLVNAHREEQGLEPLKTLETVDRAAGVRARESAGIFSHTRPDGTRCFTVFAEYELRYKNAGENLAYGYKTPEAAVKAWMDSKGHRANILKPEFAYIGVGYYITETGRIYCSQLFYTPKAA